MKVKEEDIPYVISYMHEDRADPSGNDRCAGRSLSSGVIIRKAISSPRHFIGRIQCACTYIQCESDIRRSLYASAA